MPKAKTKTKGPRPGFVRQGLLVQTKDGKVYFIPMAVLNAHHEPLTARQRKDIANYFKIIQEKHGATAALLPTMHIMEGADGGP
jgi:hypothetical protein